MAGKRDKSDIGKYEDCFFVAPEGKFKAKQSAKDSFVVLDDQDRIISIETSAEEAYIKTKCAYHDWEEQNKWD